MKVRGKLDNKDTVKLLLLIFCSEIQPKAFLLQAIQSNMKHDPAICQYKIFLPSGNPDAF